MQKSRDDDKAVARERCLQPYPVRSTIPRGKDVAGMARLRMQLSTGLPELDRV